MEVVVTVTPRLDTWIKPGIWVRGIEPHERGDVVHLVQTNQDCLEINGVVAEAQWFDDHVEPVHIHLFHEGSEEIVASTDSLSGPMFRIKGNHACVCVREGETFNLDTEPCGKLKLSQAGFAIIDLYGDTPEYDSNPQQPVKR